MLMFLIIKIFLKIVFGGLTGTMFPAAACCCSDSWAMVHTVQLVLDPSGLWTYNLLCESSENIIHRYITQTLQKFKLYKILFLFKVFLTPVKPQLYLII